MKKYIFSLTLLVSLAVAISCTDESKDPVQFEKITKGTILALRGTALQNAFFVGKPVAETFPTIATATEAMTFEAEYLAEDPASLASLDVFAVRKGGQRTLVTNVPFSQFKNDGKYPRPYVSVSLGLPQVLSALGISNTFPLSAATANTLLSDYKFGIPIEIDLNLADGSKVLASQIVASGLFQSSQFFPAQKLTWAVTGYCPYVANTWAGNYEALEIYSNGIYGPYTISFSQDGTNPNRFNTGNFWDSGYGAYIVFTPSTLPTNQAVEFPAQTAVGGGTIARSVGAYDECTKTFKINVSYTEGGATYAFRYEFKKL